MGFIKISNFHFLKEIPKRMTRQATEWDKAWQKQDCPCDDQVKPSWLGQTHSLYTSVFVQLQITQNENNRITLLNIHSETQNRNSEEAEY